MDPTSHRYWAFLSYSHRDERWARWLHKSVETYRGHRRLVGMSNRRGETIPERLFPVFRDRDELAGAADLPASITQALQSSRFLVVLCSPSSAKSTYVDQEIRYFKSIGRQDRILALIIDGEPHAVDRPDLGAEECFPEALKFAIDPEGRVTSRRMEPVAADVRPGKDGKRNALLKIVSGILGVGFDELRQRDQERRMRLLVMAATGGLVGVIVFAVLAVVAYVQRNEARDARARAEQATRLETEARISAEARALAIQAEAQRIKDRSDLALLLGIEAHRRHGALDGYQPVLAALEHEPRLRGFLHGHRRAVSALALSPDGGQMASGDRDGEVWIWDIAGSQLSGRRLYTHPSPVNKLAFRQQSAHLLSVDDHGVELRDVKTGGQVAPRLQGHPERIISVAFTPDGTKAALAGRFKVTLWNLSDWKQQGAAFIPDDTILSGLAFTSDGRRLLTAGAAGHLQLWDVEKQQVVSQSRAHPVQVLSAAVSPDGAYLATGSDWVTLWNAETLKLRGESQPGESNAMGLAFAPDRPWLASANFDGKARLWNLAKSAPIEPALRHASPVVSVAFGQKGRLATGTQAGAIYLWDLDARHRLATEVAIPDSVQSVTFGPGSRLILGTDGGGLLQYDWEARRFVGETVRILEGGMDPFKLIASPEGVKLAIAGLSTVALWNLQTGERTFTLRHSANKGHVPALAFNSTGTQLATGGIDGVIRLWNLHDGSSVGPALEGHEGSVLSLAFDSSGSTLASGGGDNSIRLWDAKTQRQKGNPFLGHKHPVFAVAFSEAARELISLDRSGEIRFWDTNSGRSTVAIGGETVACVVAGSFNANRRWLAYARQCMSDWSLGTGASIRIWDLRSREFLEFESGGLVLPAPAWGELSINADGTKVALASGHAVLVWDVLPTLWETKACQIANRNLSVAEWEKYVNSGAKYPYRCTCPDLPSGEGASAKCRQ